MLRGKTMECVSLMGLAVGKEIVSGLLFTSLQFFLCLSLFLSLFLSVYLSYGPDNAVLT